MIGNVEVKTKSVHFYVQRKTNCQPPGPITFDVDLMNVGGAMNSFTGEFTVPVNGIYHFEFRCLKREVPNESTILLRVRQRDPPPVTLTNNISGLKTSEKRLLNVASAFMANLSYSLSGSLTASLKLKAGDVVYLYSYKYASLYDSDSHYTQFAGWLVEEDLMLD